MEDEMLRDRIVCGVGDNALRRQLLQKKNLTLQSCEDMCRASEATAHHLRALWVEVKICIRFKTSQVVLSSLASRVRETETQAKNVRLTDIPARGKTCAASGKLNHYARKCRSTRPGSKIRHVHVEDSEQDSDESDPQVMTLTLEPEREDVHSVTSQRLPLQVFATMRVEAHRVRFQLDTGATCNVLCKKDVPSKVQISSTTQTLTMYNRDMIKPLGKCRVRVVNPKNEATYDEDFVVISDAPTSILGAITAQRMGLVQFDFEQIQRLTASIATPSCSKEQLLKSYSNVFFFNGELGCLEGTTHLETDPTVRKVHLPVRKTSVATKKLLQSELDRLQTLGVVEKIDRPTDWVSCPITVKKSNGNVRICLDPKPLNRALKRSHYPVPTLTDILPEFTKARIFTVADVRNGFWHVQLDRASSDLTTLNTPFGRYCWRRLPFAISPAPEIFQRKLHEALEGMDGVYTIADDIQLLETVIQTRSL